MDANGFAHSESFVTSSSFLSTLASRVQLEPPVAPANTDSVTVRKF